MMNKMHWFLSFISFLFLSACFVNTDREECIKGKEASKTEEREVPSFNKLDISGMQQVYITQGEQFLLNVNAPSDLLPIIKSSVEGEVLRIWDESCLEDAEQVQIYITVPSLKSIKASGIGSITAVNKLEADILTMSIQGAIALKMELDANEVNMTIPGAADIKLLGACELLDVSSSGAANIDAASLISSHARIVLTGAANCTVNAVQRLDATINGIGLIEYQGNPEVKKQVNGLGKIMKSDSEEAPAS